MKNIDAVIQYLDWAMLAAHRESSPDCSEVHVKYDLERRTTTTSYVTTGDEKRPMLVTLREATVLRDVCNRRITDLKDKIGRCAGSLYPGIMSGQIDEIEALFEKLTTFSLDSEEAA